MNAPYSHGFDWAGLQSAVSAAIVAWLYALQKFTVLLKGTAEAVP
jgi:hypothetical protein